MRTDEEMGRGKKRAGKVIGICDCIVQNWILRIEKRGRLENEAPVGKQKYGSRKVVWIGFEKCRKGGILLL